MNAVVKMPNTNITAFAMNEQELVDVLRTSLYPGAADNSIKMVISYCKASSLDPMQKPVHIVPMWDNKAKAMRDVIMPGVGLYRTQAARSGALAGVTEPEFGPDKTEKIGGVEITYPEWCKVTVKRELPSGKIVEFTAVERWKENYAVKGGQEKSIAPNAMWSKRPYGQIAKCAQAQAFRVGFPEAGAAPTADEMEGKALEDYEGVNTIDGATGEVVPGPQRKPEAKTEQKTQPTTTENSTDTADTTLAKDGQKRVIRAKLEAGSMTETDLKAKFGKVVDELVTSEVNAVLAWINNPGGE